MKYTVFLFLFLSFFNTQAQNKADYISEEKITAYVKNWRLKDGFKYLEAMGEAKEVFIVGQKVNQTLLKQHFVTNNLPLLSEELRNNDLQEYMLFAGGNGIIGQAIVLFVNKDDKVEKLEIIGWGR